MKRYNEEGRVGVVYAPGYGAGWSTWNEDYAEVLMFHHEIVDAVLDIEENDWREYDDPRAKDRVDQALKAIFGPDTNDVNVENSVCIYTGAADQLVVEWVRPNVPVKVNEYDGYESLKVSSDFRFVT